MYQASYMFELDTPATSKKDLPKAMLSACHYKRENFLMMFHISELHEIEPQWWTCSANLFFVMHISLNFTQAAPICDNF